MRSLLRCLRLQALEGALLSTAVVAPGIDKSKLM